MMKGNLRKLNWKHLYSGLALIYFNYPELNVDDVCKKKLCKNIHLEWKRRAC